MRENVDQKNSECGHFTQCYLLKKKNFLNLFRTTFLFISILASRLRNSAEVTKYRKTLVKIGPHPTGIYLSNIDIRNTRAMRKICSKPIIKTPERCQWCHSGAFIAPTVSIVEFELWTSKYRLGRIFSCLKIHREINVIPLPCFKIPFWTAIKQMTPLYISYHESNKNNDRSSDGDTFGLIYK